MMTTKGVTFNLNKEDQVKLHDYAMNKKNFSGYVKNLIAQDMKRAESLRNPPNSGGIRFSL